MKNYLLRHASEASLWIGVTVIGLDLFAPHYWLLILGGGLMIAGDDALKSAAGKVEPWMRARLEDRKS
jgi:hypothetical protein